MTLGDGFTIEWTTAAGVRERHRFEPRETGFWRVHEAHTGCRWRTLGREPVTDVVLERQAEIET